MQGSHRGTRIRNAALAEAAEGTERGRPVMQQQTVRDAEGGAQAVGRAWAKGQVQGNFHEVESELVTGYLYGVRERKKSSQLRVSLEICPPCFIKVCSLNAEGSSQRQVLEYSLSS